jgi:hypothetical protein
MEKTYPDVPADFGHWLAGFIDGEGSFVISSNNLGGYRVCFGVHIRGDDRPVLEECVDRTGIGYLVDRSPSPGRVKENPTTGWSVVRKLDCQRLVEILDRYPLRAKKARDYAIWREAVDLHSRMRNGYPARGMTALSWEPIARLRDELRSGRAYPATHS